MVNSIERPLVAMRLLGMWLATRFPCLFRQSLVIGGEVRDFCLGDASSELGGAMLVTWMFGGPSWPSIICITLLTWPRATRASSVPVPCR